MAQQFYPINLKDNSFPMLSEQQTRTVIGNQVGRSPSGDMMPKIAYCHNVMPSEYGVDAIGYITVVPAVSNLNAPDEKFTDVRAIYSEQLTKRYLLWGTTRYVRYYNNTTRSWEFVHTSPTGIVDTNKMTTGVVNGVSYIMYPNNKLYTFSDYDLLEFKEVEVTGLNLTQVLGVVGSSGYLIAYTKNAIAWSSTTDPTDFVPSEVTGAGGGNVADIDGDILFVTANSLGILIYTAGNVIAGTYTGNSRYPFKFRVVNHSKGGIDLPSTAYESLAASQYVYSKAGIQAINSSKAEVTLPEVTDFLAGRRFEDYNEETGQLEVTNLTLGQTMKKRMSYIASRYLVISYGLPTGDFTHALVVDTVLNRLGKLKHTHVDVIEFVAEQTEISKETIALLARDGTLVVVDFSTSADANGVVMLGKLQTSHTRTFTLLGVEVENIPTDFPMQASAKLSYDGKNTVDIAPRAEIVSPNLRQYMYKDTGKDISLVFTGAFNLVTMLVRYTINGRR